MYEGPIQDLIDELSRLPGVGPKSAQRLAFHLVKAQPEEAQRLADAIRRAKERIHFCRDCGNVAEAERCRICSDQSRDGQVLCVVEEPKDVATIEKAAVMRGRYHVLGGAISPLDGVGPEDLRVQELELPVVAVLPVDHELLPSLANKLLPVLPFAVSYVAQ